jgi:protein-S-isoprenylcysteine O-methyltransferase Ste14
MEAGSGRPEDQRDTAGIVAPPPLIYLAALAIGFGLAAALGFTSVAGAVRWPVGIVLLLAGVGLLGSVIALFTRARTSIDPYHPTTAIVTTGSYRFTRNPAYLGMTLVYCGVAVMAGALWALVPLTGAVIVIDRGVIAREERYLERKFAGTYTSYKARTRRWL